MAVGVDGCVGLGTSPRVKRATGCGVNRTAFGTLNGAIVGFYFGGRAASPPPEDGAEGGS